MIDRPFGWTMPASRRGHTLIEVLMAAAILGVLMIAMGSAILVTTRAIDDRSGPAAAITQTGRLLDRITRDLKLAISFSERTPNAVTFTVPDRDGDGQVETIRYAWAAPPDGSAPDEGSPLTLSYNNLDAVVIADGVHAFDLTYLVTTISGTGGSDENVGGGALNVLMVVDRVDNLGAREVVRQFLLESWGYVVTLIEDEAFASDYDAAVPLHDVAYVSDEVNDGQVDTKLTNAAIGVVVEHKRLGENLQLLRNQTDTQGWASVVIDDNSHYILQPFFPGLLPILTEQEQLLHYDVEDGEMGEGVAALAHSVDNVNEGMLFVIETGELLYGGGTATGRRVIMPWGQGFDFTVLNDDGRTMLKRALQWAAEKEETATVEVPFFAQSEDPTANDQAHSLKWSKWAMVSIVPSLPAEAVSWTISSFRFRAQQDGDDMATLVIQVRGRNPDGSPKNDVLAQDFFSEADLPLVSDWVTVSVTQTESIPAGEGAFIAVGMLAGDKGGIVYYESGLGEATTGNQYYWDVPNDWSTNIDKDMPCEVTGTYQTSLLP